MGLAPLVKQTIRPRLLHPHRKFFTAAEARQHTGDRVRSLVRHGKRLAIYTNRGILLCGAGMSGYWHTGPTRKHDIFSLQTAATTYYYNDTRRFGSAIWLPLDTDWISQHRLGVDGFNELLIAPGRGELLRTNFQHHPNWSMKVALLDQSCVAGIGNIYASEVLWRTRTHPATTVANFHQWPRLARTIFAVLHAALAGRGTTIRGANKYRPVSGVNRGLTLAVYDRAGQPCYRCQRMIFGSNLGGRSTYFCLHCQSLGEPI